MFSDTKYPYMGSSGDRKRWIDVRFSKRVQYLILLFYLKKLMPIYEASSVAAPLAFIKHLEDIADGAKIRKSVCDSPAQFYRTCRRHVYSTLNPSQRSRTMVGS